MKTPKFTTILVFLATLISLFLISCTDFPTPAPYGTITPPPENTPVTPDPTLPGAASPTPLPPSAMPSSAPTEPSSVPPTATPNLPTPEPTPTQIAVPVEFPESLANLLQNPGFEGGDRPVPGGAAFWGWDTWACDVAYVGHTCPAPRRGEGNPLELVMRLPEFKLATLDKDQQRVHKGFSAQQWFCFFGSCDAGVYQTIVVPPGAWCEASAYVQSWSDAGLTGDPHRSYLETEDYRINSQWRIVIDPTGGTDPYRAAALVSRVFGYDDNIYDQYVRISYVWRAATAQATVYFLNLRIWPIETNDNYIDDASVRCTYEGAGPQG